MVLQELRAIQTNHIVFGAALALGTPWQQAALVLHNMRFEANRCHMVLQWHVGIRSGGFGKWEVWEISMEISLIIDTWTILNSLALEGESIEAEWIPCLLTWWVFTPLNLRSKTIPSPNHGTSVDPSCLKVMALRIITEFMSCFIQNNAMSFFWRIGIIELPIYIQFPHGFMHFWGPEVGLQAWHRDLQQHDAIDGRWVPVDGSHCSPARCQDETDTWQHLAVVVSNRTELDELQNF